MITDDPVALDLWHPVAFAGDAPIRTRILGQEIDAAPGHAALPGGRPLPVRQKWGLTFTTLGRPIATFSTSPRPPRTTAASSPAAG